MSNDHFRMVGGNRRFDASIKDVPPVFAERVFTKMGTVDRGDGLPDGFHSGGCWLEEESGEVWKPMLNFVNHARNPYFVPSKEYVFFYAMKEEGVAICPNNWWMISGHDGRLWMVRKFAYRFDDYIFSPEQRLAWALFVEKGVRYINNMGWEIGDSMLGILVDFNLHRPFIVDGSCAQFVGFDSNVPFQADDTDALYAWWKSIGMEWLVNLRLAGRSVLTDRHKKYDVRGQERWHQTTFKHVYLSSVRPFSFIWAEKEDREERIVGVALPRSVDAATHERGVQGHTWIVTAEALSDEYIKSYELTHAFSMR